jgi:hypothetical protein
MEQACRQVHRQVRQVNGHFAGSCVVAAGKAGGVSIRSLRRLVARRKGKRRRWKGRWCSDFVLGSSVVLRPRWLAREEPQVREVEEREVAKKRWLSRHLRRMAKAGRLLVREAPCTVEARSRIHVLHFGIV